MIKRILIIGILISFTGILGFAKQEVAAIKIGVVDIRKITEQAKMVKEMVDEMEKALKKKQEAAEQKTDEYRKSKQELDQQALVLTEEEKEKKRKELRQLQLEIEDIQYDINSLLERQNKEVVGPAMKKIIKAVEEVGKARNLELIVPLDVVLYHSAKCDVTQDVIDRLNQAHKQEKQATPEF